ncbi:MAG: DNA starvation/stationary phase protection protein Dps, partial [Nevskia sp.]|nr:DNA starvation/stationary phase protection protein Dps [Nevskia sp.]
MSAYTTRIDIPAEARGKIVELLNQQLADTLDLFTQIKQAHWNVKGIHFISLHELFDKLAEEAEDYTDDLAERATALGGVALGTARVTAKASRLPEFPLQGMEGKAAVQALAERYAPLAASTRKAIDSADALGDAGTADLFTGISRGLDKSLWFL